jgi:hypothetical protein
MKGTILTYYPGRTKPDVCSLDGPATLAVLKAAIGGGHLEAVPHWRRIRWDGKQHSCVAFCDEDGKRKELPFNANATTMWDGAMRHACGVGCAPDFLVGQIAVVFGDAEFMETL